MVLEFLSARRHGAPVVPIPAELVERVQELAAELGPEMRVVEARDLLSGRPVAGLRQRSSMAGPAVVALPSVAGHLIALAECISGRPIVGGPRIREGEEPILVLMDRATPVDAAWDALTSLGRRGASFAVLPVDDGPAGRLALLKALLFPSAEALDVERVELLPVAPAPVARRGVLLVSGHGNAIDLGGGWGVVCPRSDGGQRDVTGLYPCFGDGRCFRQPLFGRMPEALEGLVDPARFRHALVLLLGCGTFALGEEPFARRGTILWRMTGSDTLAAVATTGAFYHDANVETALLALLLEGHPLGEAVRIFNAWHREAYGATSPAGEDFGPLVAIGNPTFRLRSGLIAAVPRTTDFGVDLNGCGIVRVAGGDVANDLLLSASLAAIGTGVRIAGARGDEDVSTYVSVRPPAGACDGGSFALQPFDRQACIAERARLRDTLPKLALWRLLLGDAACPMARALGADGVRIVAEADLSGIERLMRAYLAMNAFDTDALVATRATLSAHRLVLDRWASCRAVLLGAAHLYVQRTGGFLFHLWQQFYMRGGGEEGRQSCPACGRDTAYLSYGGPADPGDRHHVVHCPACGVLGQLPHGVTLRADQPLDPCRAGEVLTFAVDVGASRAASLQGEFLLVRESWFHAGEDAVASGPIDLDPGKVGSISFALPISPDLVPGLYPLTLLGIVNGGLVQIRRHLSIAEDRR